MQGVLVGTDNAQEWLLPWWWEHYSRHNDYPVAFADFGMSAGARAWCAERGAVIEVPAPKISEKELRENPQLAHLFNFEWIKKLEKRGKLWDLRKVWFKKPVAFSLSPFQRTLWLDLDCEVRKSLEPLFVLPLSASKFAARLDRSPIWKIRSEHIQFNHYHAGVVLFEEDSPVIKLWVENIEGGSKIAYSEEHVLDLVLWHFKIPIFELTADFNWSIHYGPNEQALIYHWIGEEKKEEIRQMLFGKGQSCKAS